MVVPPFTFSTGTYTSPGKARDQATGEYVVARDQHQHTFSTNLQWVLVRTEKLGAVEVPSPSCRSSVFATTMSLEINYKSIVMNSIILLDQLSS